MNGPSSSSDAIHSATCCSSSTPPMAMLTNSDYLDGLHCVHEAHKVNATPEEIVLKLRLYLEDKIGGTAILNTILHLIRSKQIVDFSNNKEFEYCTSLLPLFMVLICLENALSEGRWLLCVSVHPTVISLYIVLIFVTKCILKRNRWYLISHIFLLLSNTLRESFSKKTDQLCSTLLRSSRFSCHRRVPLRSSSSMATRRITCISTIQPSSSTWSLSTFTFRPIDWSWFTKAKDTPKRTGRTYRSSPTWRFSASESRMKMKQISTAKTSTASCNSWKSTETPLCALSNFIRTRSMRFCT